MYMERTSEELHFGISVSPSIAVSLVIAVFNKQIYLDRCMNSLKRQSFQNFEIIFSDDCSTDNSTAYIINQMKANPRIKLVQHTYNQGTCSSRNHAVLSTSGHYIMSLDPDDEFYDNGIGESYNNAVKFNADVLDYIIFVQKKNLTYILPTCAENQLNSDDVLKQLQVFNYHKSYWNVCKKIIRRSIYYRSVLLMMPFVQDKKIANGEDILHCGVVYLFMKNYYCGHFTPYLYYKNVNDSASSRGYDKARQGQMQIKLAKLLTNYFYFNRNELSKCSLDDFLANMRNRRVYKIVRSIDKTPVKSCDIDCSQFKSTMFDMHGYCLIERK